MNAMDCSNFSANASMHVHIDWVMVGKVCISYVHYYMLMPLNYHHTSHIDFSNVTICVLHARQLMRGGYPILAHI